VACAFTALLLGTAPFVRSVAAEPDKATAAASGVQLVTSAKGAVNVLSREEATQLLLGHRNRLNDGTPVTLIDLPSGQIRARLYQILTGKNPVQVRANWSRLVFSGRVRPPLEASNENEALEWLINTPNAIGYLPSAVNDKRIKVLLLVDG
jgi:hypothetical protein